MERSQATWAAQAAVAAAWVWKLKTVVHWGDDVALLDQLEQAEGAKRTAWRNAARRGTVRSGPSRR